MPSPHSPAQAESLLSPDPAADFAPRHCRLEAKASELGRAREYADRAAASFGFDEAERFQLVFALNEAVTNAIRHGGADEAGTIGLYIAAEGDCLVLDVCDCGRFVTASEDDDPMADHGRGFALMGKLMDHVQVRSTAEGTTVRLGKRRRAVADRSGGRA
jgi:serine/threonine-protein kinase RsbW